jgi:hypothetical protein
MTGRAYSQVKVGEEYESLNNTLLNQLKMPRFNDSGKV